MAFALFSAGCCAAEWVHAEQTEDTAGSRTHSDDHRPREVADDSLFSVEQ